MKYYVQILKVYQIETKNIAEKAYHVINQIHFCKQVHACVVYE